ncbi:TadE/TadG family type IV pilus assembly protein [Ruania zhangjianzhongii]|uniref:TadE/TadG family type IV pilus assembly protein n=1 Tax=Ruania zhangjianzhongii TaxID=2603206 RepID=UPI001F412980|nr:TadE/TadG family type IV pilus assembly protein [Ruania zhangjianzhongii]
MDFLLVSVLVTVLVLGVVQLALTLHVRTSLIDSAAEGARYAALDGNSLADGAARTRWLIDSSLPADYAQQVETGRADYRDVQVVEVHIAAPVPVLGLLGPAGMIDVTGRAVDERR